MIVTFWGLPRAGKTTALAWGASCALRKRPARLGRAPFGGIVLGEFGPNYDRILSNFPLKGAYQYNPSELGSFKVENALILCDEASLVFYCRDHKTNERAALDWLCLHGHARCDVWFASQGLDDCDKRIRNLTAQLVHVEKSGGRSRLVPYFVTENPDKPTEQLFTAGGFMLTRSLKQERFWGMFDSFDMPELPEKMLVPW